MRMLPTRPIRRGPQTQGSEAKNRGCRDSFMGACRGHRQIFITSNCTELTTRHSTAASAGEKKKRADHVISYRKALVRTGCGRHRDFGEKEMDPICRLCSLQEDKEDRYLNPLFRCLRRQSKQNVRIWRA